MKEADIAAPQNCDLCKICTCGFWSHITYGGNCSHNQNNQIDPKYRNIFCLVSKSLFYSIVFYVIHLSVVKIDF